ncbi:GH32 C-terminal domain-containing protein [Paenibacillus sp. MMO-177]|uniref:GH32 C-terminal domain-containing protein n=1 Tax=Paenibacillus sp. MMO-177 TaxID=3081289 RepID=UPI00301657ED
MKANASLSGWRVTGKGTLEETGQGMLITSEPSDNAIVMSETRSDDFIYEADIQIKDVKADASLVFRSNEDGWSSYMLQIVPNAGLLRLKDARGGDGKLFQERRVTLKEGEIYHLKVKAEGDNLKVYWGSQYKPIIDVNDSAYRTGYLGLHVWDGSALFQNIQVSRLNGNLGQTIARQGTWQPDLKGDKGIVSGQSRAVKIYEKLEADFVYEGNIALGNTGAEAALAFRTNADGSQGYEALLKKEGDQVRVRLQKSDGTIIRDAVQAYPSQPASVHHLEVNTAGKRIRVFIDGYTPAAIDVMDSSFVSGYVGYAVGQGTASFQNTYVTAASDYYTEKYRPQYHYSPIRGSASDPNGLVFFDGEYHLFHQDGGTWAHAVSTDLVHWKQLPIALPWNDLGHKWSGSAVADMNNASGLFGESGGKGLIAYYTSYNPDAWNGNQRIGIAYSADKGRTWQYGPIVIENPGKNGDDPGGWDFRDPKVVWDNDHNRWVMVVSGGDHVRIFTSTNLIDWTLTDLFGYGNYVRGGVWECPDLFQLPVDGSGEMKWVLMISTGANPKTAGSDAEYFIGELTAEGKFVNDNPAGKVLKTDFGKEFYASMTFADMPNDRRVMLAWMTNWDYPFAFPTSGWSGEMTIPRELSLKPTEEGLRLFQAPIKELSALRNNLFSAVKKVIGPDSQNLLKGQVSGAYEIEAELEIPAGSTVTEFGFNLREGGGGKKTVVGYKTGDSRMFVDRAASGVTDFSPQFTTYQEAHLTPDHSRVKMNVFVDESSVEVFGNDGRVVFSDVILPDPASRAMSFYAKGGEVKVVSMKVYALDNTWREHADSSAKVVMDTTLSELSAGQTQTLYAAVENDPGKGAQPIVWKSSNPGVVKLESQDKSSATIKAVGIGEAFISASVPNGKASASVKISVTGDEFKTNLSGWHANPSGSDWVLTDDGIRGSYFTDANYMAQETAGNFTYEADMKLAETGGAGSILFRASEDGQSGYYFNLDTSMKAFRLFYKVDGRFEERQVLARVPYFVQAGLAYKVKIIASGPHIEICVGGQKIIDLNDGTFAEGHFGVNVFGGRASYQNVHVSDASDAKLDTVAIINDGLGKRLSAAQSQNGEAVTIGEAGETAFQSWVLVPTGDERGSYSIRTTGGKALDLDTGQNKLQLYTYLGYDNQRWTIANNEDGTVTISNVNNGKVLGVTEDGTQLLLNDRQPDSDRQRWRLQEVTALNQ